MARHDRGSNIDLGRANLLSSWGNVALTLVSVVAIAFVVVRVVDWAVLSAVFSGADGSACRAPEAGACWPFVWNKLGLFMYGRYPEPERWRINLTYVLAL